MGYADIAVRREYARRWKAAKREVWLKQHGPCVKCGSAQNLEVDHIDPSTKVDHKVWTWSAIRRAAELAKCQVLCEKCHLKKTLDSRQNRTSHGQGQMYQRYKCRCEMCRKWKHDSDAKYRKTT